MTKFFHILGVLTFGFCTLVQADPVEIPSLTSPVIDQVGVLHSSEKYRIEERLQSYKDFFQMQVWIAPTLGDDSIESLSIRAVEKWKLGSAKEDKGLLLLIAVNERQMRLEVGHGLEGDIPDALAGRILDYLLRPALRAGNYGQGINDVITEITAILKVGENIPERQVSERQGGSGMMKFLLPLFLLLIFGNFISGIFGLGRRRRGFWGGGGGWGGGGWGGGSGWGGGGGSFGGGGASSNW